MKSQLVRTLDELWQFDDNGLMCIHDMITHHILIQKSFNPKGNKGTSTAGTPTKRKVKFNQGSRK
jgi:hypothetical protein